jgi:hypothetical protein
MPEMPPVAPDIRTQHTPAQHLRETNSRLCVWLDDLAPNAISVSRASSGSMPSAISNSQPTSMPAATPRQMAGLLAELMRAGQCLRELPSEHERDAALETEVNQYRKNVERLRDLMPSIHGALLRERARLEQERARVESAAEWVRRSRQTF